MSVSAKQSETQRLKLLLRGENSSARMWLSFTGGGLAWTFHLMASAALAEWGAVAGLDERSYLGINLIVWAVMAVTGLSVVVALAALWETLRIMGHFRRLVARQTAMENAEASGASSELPTGAYLMAVGICSNFVFLLVILAQTMPLLFYWGAS